VPLLTLSYATNRGFGLRLSRIQTDTAYTPAVIHIRHYNTAMSTGVATPEAVVLEYGATKGMLPRGDLGPFLFSTVKVLDVPGNISSYLRPPHLLLVRPVFVMLMF